MVITLDCKPLKFRQTGVGTYVYQLIRHLAGIGAANTYRCFYSSLSMRFLRNVPDFKEPNITRIIRRLPSRLLYRIWGSKWSRLIPMEALAGDADVFHFTNFLSSHHRSGGAVLTVYDLSILRYPQWHPFGRQRVLSSSRLRWSIEHVDFVLAISEFTKRELISVLGIDPDKIRVTPLGVEDDFFNETPLPEPVAEPTSPFTGPFILSVATLEPRKNLPRLIRAYALAKKELRFPHRLVLAGMRGWLWGDIFKTVSKFGLEKDVIFPNYVPRSRLPWLMRKSSLFVYPSLYEGFGLPPLEAMACGTPVIVSNTGALSELVGDAGMQVDPYEVNDIADAICRLLSDQQLRTSYARRGQTRAAQFSWKETAKRTLSAYVEAANSR